jgi:hypothetical protein
LEGANGRGSGQHAGGEAAEVGLVWQLRRDQHECLQMLDSIQAALHGATQHLLRVLGRFGQQLLVHGAQLPPVISFYQEHRRQSYDSDEK